MSDAVITRVNGPVVEIRTDGGLAMLDLVEVGPHRLAGEVISLQGPAATVQVYEYTGGLRPGDEVIGTGGPLAVDLGPGLARWRVRRDPASASVSGRVDRGRDDPART